MHQANWPTAEMHEGQFRYEEDNEGSHHHHHNSNNNNNNNNNNSHNRTRRASEMPHVHDGNVVVMIPAGNDSAYPQAGTLVRFNIIDSVMRRLR